MDNRPHAEMEQAKGGNVMPRTCTLLAALVLITATVLVSLVAAMPLGTITEFALSSTSSPFRIAAGPDAHLWFTDQGTRAIGRITTDGTIAEFSIALNGGNAGSVPRQIKVGADGNIWFTDVGAIPAIGRITASGTITEYSLPTGSVPTALAVGTDGNLWFTDKSVGAPAIGRITPSGAITEFGIAANGGNIGSLPNGITSGPDGNLWFTDQGATKAIGRITTNGAITEFSAGLNAPSLPAAITPGPDGNIWFTDQGTPSAPKAIGRITTAGQITELSSGLSANSLPGEITPGADGNVWFTDQGTTPKAIGRITPSGTTWTVAMYPLNTGSIPNGFRTGPDGNLWFTDTGTTKAIGQFGVGAPMASIAQPVVDGSGRQGTQQMCDGARWADWAGQQPSLNAFGFDGYQWRIDGNAVTGETAQSYTPAVADIGHELSCTVTVTYTLFPTTESTTSAPVIVSAQPPTLTLPNDLAVEATNPAGIAVSYTATATDPIDGPIMPTCTPASGTTFSVSPNNVAAHTVTCSATNSFHVSASGSFSVLVVDTTPPTLHLPSELTVDANSPNGAVVSFIATATDLVDITDQVDCQPASGSPFRIGHTAVTCAATDKHGNTSAPRSFDVYVKGASAQIGDQIALVASTGGGSFASQLESALAQFAGGSYSAACGSLGAYINHLRAQSGKQFSVSQANALIANANRIRVLIGC
jgi:streptogramin lyase